MRHIEQALNLIAHKLGYDCHVMLGREASAHLEDRTGIGHHQTGPNDRELWCSGLRVIISKVWRAR